MEPQILYTEKQRFTQWWFWLIVIGINVLFVVGNYQQVLCGKPFGDHPMSDNGLLFGFGITLAVTYLLINIRLETIIKSDGVYVRFFPIHIAFKKYSWERLDKIFVRHYKPIPEYGGWGLRYGIFGNGIAYNIKGNQGLQLIFTDGTKLLIGTQNPEEINRILHAIDAIKSKTTE